MSSPQYFLLFAYWNMTVGIGEAITDREKHLGEEVIRMMEKEAIRRMDV